MSSTVRQTQTDVEAFVPYGTSSARHKEQPGHAENRPTKREAACKQFAGALQVSFQSEHASSSGLPHILGQGQRCRVKIPGGLGGIVHPGSAAEEVVHVLPKK